MQSDPGEILVAFLVGVVVAVGLIFGWAYESAKRKGKLRHLDDEDDE